MKTKIITTLLFSIMLVSMVSAGIVVQPGEELELMQIQPISPHTLDLSGIDRTYLFCSWELGDQGESAVQMTTNDCPEVPITHIFDDDVQYLISINYVDTHYDGTQWIIDEEGYSASVVKDYEIDLPEPELGFFDSAIANIISLFQSWRCGIFPFLGNCP